MNHRIDNNVVLAVRLKRKQQRSSLTSKVLVLLLGVITIINSNQVQARINSNQLQAIRLCSLCDNNNNDYILSLSDYSLPDPYRYNVLYLPDADDTVTCEEVVNEIRQQLHQQNVNEAKLSSKYCTNLQESGFYKICGDCDNNEQQQPTAVVQEEDHRRLITNVTSTSTIGGIFTPTNTSITTTSTSNTTTTNVSSSTTTTTTAPVATIPVTNAPIATVPVTTAPVATVAVTTAPVATVPVTTAPLATPVAVSSNMTNSTSDTTTDDDLVIILPSGKEFYIFILLLNRLKKYSEQIMFFDPERNILIVIFFLSLYFFSPFSLVIHLSLYWLHYIYYLLERWDISPSGFFYLLQ